MHVIPGLLLEVVSHQRGFSKEGLLYQGFTNGEEGMYYAYTEKSKTGAIKLYPVAMLLI